MRLPASARTVTVPPASGRVRRFGRRTAARRDARVQRHVVVDQPRYDVAAHCLQQHFAARARGVRAAGRARLARRHDRGIRRRRTDPPETSRTVPPTRVAAAGPFVGVVVMPLFTVRNAAEPAAAFAITCTSPPLVTIDCVALVGTAPSAAPVSVPSCVMRSSTSVFVLVFVSV